ncbi:hypothetical protein [Streptococcus moroccensis]|uniref:Phage protein n=1 Tax=Streptococcus moroccensis TaxID=1451356 RepID=A0ABT9YPS1_9STRE|nr:hypothetical protein [Streptococcus moroccensis]MDQ0222001.1 hypothetical protein [Streptococcus moroccensis]
MTRQQKKTTVIIQETMAERIRFLEDELYNRAYKEIEEQEVQIERLKSICMSQQELIMDYEWERMNRAAMIKKYNRRMFSR